jgi:hypothetical protein
VGRTIHLCDLIHTPPLRDVTTRSVSWQGGMTALRTELHKARLTPASCQILFAPFICYSRANQLLEKWVRLRQQVFRLSGTAARFISRHVCALQRAINQMPTPAHRLIDRRRCWKQSLETLSLVGAGGAYLYPPLV